ncbi:hypothetical protein R2601_03153 [Salipiger bermudensis HTCC2601]|uniref:Uncharacterized protein n=1 Tax=Salipiger bermudensis (strain DSM 26914 / JCM 13377 / KCTC 12554 / HTCC2601) TaxID=314265 RepID=Q0FWL5_SALBH|nr:hypothetical protein R2601_03153 [Salipiger bermudensis HTCC2601]
MPTRSTRARPSTASPRSVSRMR